MANSSLSVKQGDVSYLEVYQNWMQNDRVRNNGQSTIPITEILKKLTFSKILKKPEYQIVYHQKTDDDKLMILFNDYMPGKGEEGFKQVVDYLNENIYIDLANDLNEEMQKCLAYRKKLIFSCEIINDPQLTLAIDLDDGTTTELNQTDVMVDQTTLTMRRKLYDQLKVQNSRMVEVQEHLSEFIIQNFDIIARIWSGLIHLSTTCSAFVDVQILDDFKGDKGKPVHEYKEVFINAATIPIKRILIQGDPGCGKSTYVNKLALDWANKNEYLREKFDLVFLIPLQLLNMSIEKAIQTLLPQRSIGFIEDYYKHHSSKVLLILDGFDEFREDSQFYPEVMKMVKGDPAMSHYSFFTIIVATRRSHADKVPPHFRARSLLIKGFDEHSMKQFFQKQNVPVPDEEPDSNLLVLLQNPLFCTIYCALYDFLGVNTSKLEDPYDFIKALVKNVVENEKKKREITNEEEQLKLIGAFAFQKLNSETLNVVKNLFPSIHSKMFNFFKKKPTNVQTIDMDQIQLGLLIKKKILSANGNVIGFKEEFGFPHQLIGEYLAARYFVHHCLTKSQLKQMQPKKLTARAHSKLLRELILSNPSSLPFIRFLLFEYLTYLEYDEPVVSKIVFFCLRNELCFSCYLKSNIETSTLNDITSLECGFINSDIIHDSRFFPTLAKCINLKTFASTDLSTNELIILVKWFKHTRLLTLDVSPNKNVGSSPDLFTALGNCKHLERLELKRCELSIESIDQLATCIENNCWPNLDRLNLNGIKNVGNANKLFRVLCECLNIRILDLSSCSMRNQSMNTLLSTFNSNTFQNLQDLNLSGNKKLEIDDNFYLSLLSCSKLSLILFESNWGGPIECQLTSSGQETKNALLDRGCKIK